MSTKRHSPDRHTPAVVGLLLLFGPAVPALGFSSTFGFPWSWPPMVPADNSAGVCGRGEGAAPGPRTSLVECGPDSILARPPHLPSAPIYYAHTSDAASEYRIADDYAVGTDICAVQFWGFEALWTGAVWLQCQENAPAFELAFYADNAGSPGALVASYLVTPARQPTGLLYFNNRQLNLYTVELAPCCPLRRGWLSIRGASIGGVPGDCWFQWMSSPSGDGSALQYRGTAPVRLPYDRAFCLTGARGACCLPDLTCIRLSPGECAAAGGTYQGDGTVCESDTCRATGDRCDDPFVVDTVPFVAVGTTCGFYDDYAAPCASHGLGGAEVVYRYTPVQAECLRISLCGDATTFDTQLYVWEDACPNAAGASACSDDACVSAVGVPGLSQVCVNTVPGRTYYIVIDGADPACGTYELVISSDVAAPSFAAGPGPLTVAAAPGRCDAVVSWMPPAVSDACGVPAVTASHAPGSVFPVGTTTVTYVAVGACGLTSTYTFDITVLDLEPPTLVCPPALNMPTAAGQCSAIDVPLGSAVATDSCGGLSLTNDAPSVFPLGTTLVTWTARDAAGHTATCTQAVTVFDNQPPQIVQCAPAQNLSTGGLSSIPLPDLTGLVVVADNCPATVVVTQSPPPGTMIGLGRTWVTFTVSDTTGEAASCRTSVQVKK